MTNGALAVLHGLWNDGAIPGDALLLGFCLAGAIKAIRRAIGRRFLDAFIPEDGKGPDDWSACHFGGLAVN